jgi:hypothetical protein
LWREGAPHRHGPRRRRTCDRLDGWRGREPTRALEGLGSTLLWLTDAVPTDYRGDDDPSARKSGIAPPPDGTRFATLEIQPGNQHFMHRTDTLDYVVCIAEAIDMDLDGGEVVTMQPGDVLIQRGTSHSWVACRRASRSCWWMPSPSGD